MFRCVLRLFSLLLLASSCFGAGTAQHIVVVVWDGMRPDFISPEHTPTLHRLVQDGVRFQNHHSTYCSATEVNAVAMATGAYPSHSGILANTIYLPDIEPLKPVGVENAAAVRKGDQLTGGNYLLRPTLAEILQAAGKTTVIASSKQVGLLHDRRQRTEESASGINVHEGRTLPASLMAALTNQLGLFPPPASTQSSTPNEPRDAWTTRALLGPLWSNGVPAFTLLWLSEPDSSQHAHGPGSPRALAALESSDRRLAEVLAQLERRGLRGKTDVFVVSDHGFSTIARVVDMARILRSAGFAAYREFKAPPAKGEIMVVGQGGSVLFYIGERDPATIQKLVDFLQQQDFTGVILTREPMEGTFTLEQANMAVTNHPPDVVLSFRWSAEKSAIGVPGTFTSDGGRKPGDGTHASLSHFDLHNTLVAAGPDFKRGFNGTLPSGNTDLAPTILWLLGVNPPTPMDGRVLSEALTVEAPPAGEATIRKLETRREFPHSIWYQYLQVSQVGQTLYLDEGNGRPAMK